MKLLSKINRRFIALSIPALILLTVPVYFIILTIQEDEMTESLAATQTWIANSIASKKTIPDLYPVIEVRACNEINETIIKDTVIFDPVENDLELFREFRSVKAINGTFYEITVRAYGLEKSNLAVLLFSIFLIVAIILNAILIFINLKISRSVWRPLSETIRLIKDFSLKRLSPINLPETNIDEFKNLNLEITKLTTRILSDYQNIKQFSENAAHELQTPLSVIRNKIDTLLTSQNLTKDQIVLVASIEESIDRLNRLNKGLLQLSKIENGQYTRYQDIDFNDIARETIEEFKEVLEMRSLTATVLEKGKAVISMDADLARILVNNLLNNAIKYTSWGGEITVSLNESEIRFLNSGAAPLAGGEKVFNRFYRENQSSHSTGLGLALVKSICDSNAVDVSYEFHDQFHQFILKLPRR